MRGRLDRNMITLTGGQQETITITDLVIPQEAKSGMDLLLSLVVRKEDFRRKREAQVGGSSQSGGYGGGSVGGSSQNGGYGGGSVGGSSQNGGYGGGSVGGSSQNGGSSYNPGYNQGGSVGGNSQSGGNYNGGYNNGGSVGGSSQSGGYNPGFNNNNNNGGLNWNNNNDPGYNDPSNKREVRSTVVFKVTDGTEADDETDPWTAKEYGADSKDETCTNGPGEPGCDLEYWWVKFQIQDEESGLHLVDVRAASSSGKNPYENQIYYR